MSPLERSLLRTIVSYAEQGWTVRIRAVAVESIACQMHTPTTTTLWSLLPESARRRMRAAAKRQRGVRLSVSEALEVHARWHSALQRAKERQAAEAAS